jgi:hypothetical protein
MCCSNRTKHADLTLSASHRVGQHPVKSDRSEQQRDAGKGEEHRRGKRGCATELASRAESGSIASTAASRRSSVTMLLTWLP